MTQSQFALSWDSHRNNISLGLTTLQQKGEFVDMTLAADGHLVKVHQVVMALASPYIKEIIRSCESNHPVIFLNNISYTTLCSILEYVYTGEVRVTLQDLNNFSLAAKNLHIKGLEDMKLHDLLSGYPIKEQIDDEVSESHMRDVEEENNCEVPITNEDGESEHDDWRGDCNEMNNTNYEEVIEEIEDYDEVEGTLKRTNDNMQIKKEINRNCDNPMQYTVSNQGSLQMILNRYMYYMKYTKQNKTRQWRCVDYLKTNIKCPAQVITKDDVVLLRISAHTHPFHDSKILKKVKSGGVFEAISEAELEGGRKRYENMKLQKQNNQ